MAFGKLLKVTPLPDPAVIDPTLRNGVGSVDPFAPAIKPEGSASFIQPINVPAPQAWKPSAMGILDRVLGGMTITEARQAAEADHAAELTRPRVQAQQLATLDLIDKQLKTASDLSPRELIAFLNARQDLGKAYASRQEAATVPEGGSRVFGNPNAGGSVFYAPRTKDEGGFAYSMSPEGTKVVGRVPYVPEMEKLGPGDVAKPRPTFYGERMISQPDQPQDQAGAPGGGYPAPSGPVADQIASVAAKAGASPGEVSYLQRLGMVESSLDPAATNGSSTGVFQFHPDTFAKAGGGNINDVGDQTKAALTLQRQDRQALSAMGVEPSDANVYIMHQQGSAGGRALLTAPANVNAVAALAPAYKGDTDIATAAIAGNIGMPMKTPEQKLAALAKAREMTAGEFVGLWRQKWGGGGGGQPQQAQDQGAAAPGTLYGGPGKADDDVPLTPDAIDLLAGKFLSTGVLPPMGMGKAATANRNAVMNRVSAMAKELGLSADDLVAGNASIKALGQSLNKIVTQRGAVAQLEETAKKNADLMLSLAPKGAGQTNIPVLNRWLQAGRKQIAGDVDVTKFDNALSAFSEEYAKVMSGSLGNQAATDSARADAKDRLGKYATQGQLQGGVEVMKTEMANRMQALAEVEGGIRARIRNGGRDVGEGAPGETLAPRPAFKKAIQGASDAQNAWLSEAAISGKAGEENNPFIPRTEAEFEKLRPGVWFVNPADGRKLRKMR